MSFPVVPVRRSALLTGQTNGKLDGSILVGIPGQAGGPTIRLIPPAARAWRAMQAAALAAGHTLKATSASDSYRPYDVQERIFRQRYTTTFLSGRPSRVWNGVRWYQKPGTAAAAVPGTSNHGWAAAVDTGTEIDGDAGTEAIDKATLDWLLDHADEYGWSWELQSEPWHLRYFAGDDIPAAVLAFEKPSSSPTQEALVVCTPSFAVPRNGRFPFIELRPVDDDEFICVLHNAGVGSGVELVNVTGQSPSGLPYLNMKPTTGRALGPPFQHGNSVFVACVGSGTYEVARKV